MKVGDTIWIFDHNRRRYGGPGLSAKIIWREHWRPETIHGETSRSWLYGPTWRPKKLAKNKPLPAYIVDSEAEIDRREYVHKHSPKVADLISRKVTYDQLKQIADLIGYQPDSEQ